MRHFFIFFALVLMIGGSTFQPAQAQGRNFYGFKNIVHGHAKIGLSKQIAYAPDDYYADIKGGYIEIFVSKGQCSDKYRFTWKFKDDMSKLEPGFVYNAEMTAERIEGTCRQNEAWGRLYGSNEKCALCVDENIAPTSFSLAVKAKGKEKSYAVPLDYNHDSQFEVSVSRVAEEDAMIFLSFSCTTNPSPKENFDYQVVYHYKKNYQPQTGAIGFDCHMLYGIGTNMAFLESGAQNNLPYADIKPHLSYAIQHISASNCLEPDVLIELRKRMEAEGADTKSFYEEIKAFRKELHSMIPRECIE